MKIYVILFAFITIIPPFVLPGCSLPYQSKHPRDKRMPYPHPIRTQSEAQSVADELTQLRAAATGTSVSQTTIAASNIPFIGRDFINRKVWRVDYLDCSLVFESATREYPDIYRRNFAVILDAETGRLISIESPFEGEAPDFRPEPSATYAEHQLAGSGETYVDLPSVEPGITFLEAINSVVKDGVGTPFLAKEIAGLYALHSRYESPPRPVWIITLRGTPPIPASGPGADAVPVWQLNRMRNVVDAKSGKVLFATNAPLPE